MHTAESVWEFAITDRIKFGTGALDELGSELEARAINSLVVVTDTELRDAGIVDDALESVPDTITVTVFDGVEPDPDVEIYRAAIATVASHDPDAVVGIGGGSSLDVAKAAGALAGSDQDVLEYVAPPIGEGEPVPASETTVIAVPTTAGTGSESSPAVVVSLPDRELKVGISSRHLYPELAVVDPLVTVSLPPAITAASGMDALTHAIEAYTTRRYDAKADPDSAGQRPDYGGRTPVTDLYAEKAIDLIGQNLRRAVDNGVDVEARRALSLGSLLAGIAFTNAGLGATHAMAYPVAGENHTPHGVTVAVLLPHVMRYNASSAFERYAHIAELLGENTDGMSDRDAADRAGAAVEALSSDIGLPDGLSELGVAEDDIPHLAEKTTDIERLLVGNPRRVDQAALEEIFEAAL
ncbi:putative oxidoreductase (iron-containing alcohol dehydrogenase family) [Natrialba magadii ATCC 43099]|uniref:hydroxyacid-oxoacid transhydrogenase n=1 Tax=Natrialba magadii (strain ATCC 43099 / DSM 3394 / CCM 3739 / CIP 104546 / IAM 13178 / JCM 8861 / NBRC 102185 / NCIMB 2190 / MS3) TaxID=547559 RepID=D3SYL3_NATMM|nr:hydroxyacid-oxoacid transhydrogenase [Natrialba magadii]ADD04124.1 putative oxidoreductase (iron-containing alcohol dehydrogenase family) [Natrialba magadii ATCC 43099]ELY32909.1 iron-containing alcohol dehydrogenase [Natrialba magadii ATCC 43099]